MIAAADVEQAVVDAPGLGRRVELDRAQGMRQVGDHVGGTQELASGARKHVGGRIRRAPFRDDVVVGHVLQPVPGRDEVGRRRIARPMLRMHGVEEAISRELRMKDKCDESATQPVVDRKRKRVRHIRVHVRLIVRIDPVQETARVVGETTAVGKVPHVVHPSPAGGFHVLVGGANPAGVRQARQLHDLDRQAAFLDWGRNRVAGDLGRYRACGHDCQQRHDDLQLLFAHGTSLVPGWVASDVPKFHCPDQAPAAALFRRISSKCVEGRSFSVVRLAFHIR